MPRDFQDVCQYVPLNNCAIFSFTFFAELSSSLSGPVEELQKMETFLLTTSSTKWVSFALIRYLISSISSSFTSDSLLGARFKIVTIIFHNPCNRKITLELLQLGLARKLSHIFSVIGPISESNLFDKSERSDLFPPFLYLTNTPIHFLYT